MIATGKAYSKIAKTNVEVLDVFKETATIRTWGKGLKAGEIVTRKGWPLDDLEPARPASEWEQ